MSRNAKLLLLTGPGGDAQGWGDENVTRAMAKSLSRNGYKVSIAWVETPAELEMRLRTEKFDWIWSSLYCFSSRADIVGIPENAVWVADLLEEKELPYIGCGASAMKTLIRKFTTHEVLERAGVAVPRHWLATPEDPLPECVFPAFVKPDAESRSVGIDEASVVRNPVELKERIRWVFEQFKQASVIEEYLPGEELTVLSLTDEILPGNVSVEEFRYGPNRVLRSDLRGVGLTRISRPSPDRFEEAVELSRAAVRALDCRDHVRIDMRADAAGKLRIMEVNGIPGLKPGKSWSPQLYSLYHPDPDHPDREYAALLSAILARHVKHCREDISR